MSKSRQYLTILFALIGFCLSAQNFNGLQEMLNRFTMDKNARIGVCVISNSNDTVAVNGSEKFPMMSVFKLPSAVAFADTLLKRGDSLSFKVIVDLSDLPTDTYSPLLKKYGTENLIEIDYRRLLAYSLKLSDNNACDILLEATGGTGAVKSFLDDNGFSDISVKWTEDEMHKDINRCFDNSTTPIAMARFLDAFDVQFNDSLSVQIKGMIENCETGQNRLAKPLMNADIVFGHKTGTGDCMPDGKITGINDAGYVHLPDGRRYVIAVFVTDSYYTFDETEAIIAEISKIVHQFMLSPKA